VKSNRVETKVFTRESSPVIQSWSCRCSVLTSGIYWLFKKSLWWHCFNPALLFHTPIL